MRRVRRSKPKETRPQVEFGEMPVAQLKPWGGNPRRMDQAAHDALSRSVERFGLVEPIVWNRRTRRVVGGHQRLAVLRAKKVKTAPVAIVSLSPAEEQKLNLALNNPELQGEWSRDVRALIDELRGQEEDFEGLRLRDLLDEIPLLKAGGASGELPTTDSRTVQLYFGPKQFEKFSLALAELEAAYETKNVTDTVMEAMRRVAATTEKRKAGQRG